MDMQTHRAMLKQRALKTCTMDVALRDKACAAMRERMSDYLDDEWPDKEWDVAMEVADRLGLDDGDCEWISDFWHIFA